MSDEHHVGREGEELPLGAEQGAAESAGLPERPRRLTDMDLPDYSVEEAKAKRRETRKAGRRRLRRESVLDEEGEALVQEYDQGMMRRLLTYLKPYRKQFALGVGLLLVYSALVPAFPALIALAVDRYIVAGQEPWASLSIDERLDGLLWVVLAYLGLRLVNFGCATATRTPSPGSASTSSMTSGARSSRRSSGSTWASSTAPLWAGSSRASPATSKPSRR